MSRSRRHIPICGLSTSCTNKPFKKQEHARERSAVKRLLHMGYEDWQLPHPKKYGNEWDSPRDGKQYIGDHLMESQRNGWVNGPYAGLWSHVELIESYKKMMRK